MHNDIPRSHGYSNVPHRSNGKLVWNILLAARNEGLGGRITTIPISEENQIKEYFRIPDNFAVCAVLTLGRPVKQITRLSRKEVSEFTTLEYFDGESL